MLKNGAAGISRLGSLYLICESESSSTSTVADIQALIALPEALKSFSFYFGDGPNSATIISNTEIWDSLQKHRRSLESIDIYRRAPYAIHRIENGHFGLVYGFTRLKHLCVQEAMPLGGCDSPRASFRLIDTLPSAIQSLTIYGEHGYNFMADLPTQLQELVAGDFPFLNSIVLVELENFRDDKEELQRQYQPLEQACTEKRISFRIEKADQFSIRKEDHRADSGQRREGWAKTLCMEADGQDRNTYAGAPRYFQGYPELVLGPADSIYDDEEDFDSEDEYGRYGSQTLKTHTIAFTDQAGKTANMVFMNSKDTPLPPLFSFSIYFTRVRASPEHMDMASLHEEVSSGFENEVRLDLHLLPGGNYEDCISHYQGEKAARGSYKRQIERFQQWKREVHPLPRTSGPQLPGMVIQYREASLYWGCYIFARNATAARANAPCNTYGLIRRGMQKSLAALPCLLL